MITHRMLCCPVAASKIEPAPVTASAAVSSQESDEFADFASFSSSSAPAPTSGSSSSQLFSSSNHATNSSVTADDDEFGDFVSKPVALLSKPVAPVSKPVASVSKPVAPVSNIQPPGGTAVGAIKPPQVPDKFSALKALVSDQNLYSEKPKSNNILASLEPNGSAISKNQDGDDDDWDPFVKSSARSSDMAANDVKPVSAAAMTSFAAFGDEPKPAATSAFGGVFGDDTPASATAGDNWANFTAAPPKVAEIKADAVNAGSFTRSGTQ